MRGALAFVSVLALLITARCRPYQPQRIGLLDSALHWNRCSDSILRPQRTSDVQEIVAALLREQPHHAKAQPFLLRTSHQNFFSHNNLTSCAAFISARDVASLDLLTLTMDLSHMNQLLQVDQERHTVTVQSGMTVEELEEQLLEHQLSLPGWLVTPPYAGMTLAAVLESGDQGSSLVGPSSLAAYVQAAVLVDGKGELHRMPAPGNLLEASLGMLGVVTELTLRVVPARKVQVSEQLGDSRFMVQDLLHLVQHSGALALQVAWSPAAHIYTARSWREVPSSTPGDSVFGQVVAARGWLDHAEEILAKDQEDQGVGDGRRSLRPDLMCEVVGHLTGRPGYYRAHDEGEPSQAKKQGGPWLTFGPASKSLEDKESDSPAGGGSSSGSEDMGGAGGGGGAAREGGGGEGEGAAVFTGDGWGEGDGSPLQGYLTDGEKYVGWVNRLGSARCVDEEGDDPESCLWRKVKVTPHVFSIASADLGRWSEDVWSILTSSIACPSFLIHMSFNMASQALLSPTAGRQSVSIDLQTVSSLRHSGRLLVKHQELMEEVLQMSLCKYDARPHWAMSTNRMLLNSCGPQRSLNGNIDSFVQNLLRFDPQRLFYHPLFDRIVQGSGPDYYPGCALTEDCFCQVDEHCGPNLYCVPGTTFPQHRVCSATPGIKAQSDEL